MGIPIDRIPSRTFRLFNKGKELPIYISNSQRDHLSSDDFILFYGRYLRVNPANMNNSATLMFTGLPGVKLPVQGCRNLGRAPELTDYTNSDLIKAVQFYDTVHFEKTPISDISAT